MEVGKPGEFKLGQQRTDRGIVIVKPTGCLDAHSFGKLQSEIGELFSKGYYKIIVDLSDVDYISSAGAGVFIGAQSEAHSYKGNIVLLQPTRAVRDVFDLLGLSQMFQICDDLATAYSVF